MALRSRRESYVELPVGDPVTDVFLLPNFDREPERRVMSTKVPERHGK
jgi:hypothetical protein